MKLVYGNGIIEERIPMIGIKRQSYKHWKSMICRCYSDYYHKSRPTYTDCTVCNEWLYFSNFDKWFILNYKAELVLDKDILFDGNKVYSPKTCRFVPNYLNSLLCNHQRNKVSNLPNGISYQRGSYAAACNNGHGYRLTKTSTDLNEIKEWYSITKKKIVKEQAIRAFLDNAIKSDVYLALVRREF